MTMMIIISYTTTTNSKQFKKIPNIFIIVLCILIILKKYLPVGLNSSDGSLQQLQDQKLFLFVNSQSNNAIKAFEKFGENLKVVYFFGQVNGNCSAMVWRAEVQVFEQIEQNFLCFLWKIERQIALQNDPESVNILFWPSEKLD